MTDLRNDLQASLGSTYSIERELGGAGMSRVFVADELSLGRRVVVKVLPADLAGSVSIARFHREISLAARLQHPHIVPLLSAGEIDGLPYYTMPFVDGESLRARLAHGELTIADTVSILRDVARALEYAHGKNVAHRDIKPDNVLLVGTVAVITDFGVAKALSDAAEAGPLTSVGIALGTPAYMAPEQAAADPATDFRADIYAFGAMAYEMLAGHLPFAGRTAAAMLAANAVETPQSIAALRAATPAPLAELVMRCLEKRPGDRPQSAGEILHALEALGTSGAGTMPSGGRSGATSTLGALRPRRRVIAGIVAATMLSLLALAARWSVHGGSEIRSIAVLPFENTSGDTAFAYLEDGIPDHVRDELNAVQGLTVKARSSSHLLKGRPAREVGGKLGVAAVLQGTVSGSTSHLHVTAELVRASDENVLWSSTFDRKPSELAGIQDTIVRAVTGKLRITAVDATGGRRATIAARGTSDIQAYDEFLQGRYAFDRNEFGRASEIFRKAVTRDPRFARAHAYLAMSYANAPTIGVGSLDSMNALARASIATALALDSALAEAYAAESFALLGEMRMAESFRSLGKAVMLDSSNVDLLAAYGAMLGQMGRVSEGLIQARRARDKDPLSATAVGLLSYSLELSRQHEAAITTVREALDLAPKSVIMYKSLGFYFAFNGMPDSAVVNLETAFKLDSTLFGGRSNLVFAYAVAGRWKDAARQRALLGREAKGNSPNYNRMVADLAFGENDAAMTALEQAVAAREPLLGIISIPCEPLLDPLKSNPRFAPLIQRLGARACPAAGKWPITAPGRR